MVTIDVKAILKPQNILTGGSRFFKGTFLIKAMKSITMEWVYGEVSDPFHLLMGTTSVPSNCCDLTLFFK